MLNSLHNPIASGFLNACNNYPSNNALFISNRYYTYFELLQLVKPIYRKLIKDMDGQELIGVIDDQTVYAYATILAISLSKKAYLPINPNIPKERNHQILNDANCRCVYYADETKFELLEGNKIHLSSINSQNIINNSNQEPVFINSTLAESKIAYLLFTSGTTGVPKGVPVSNANVNACFRFYRSALFHFSSEDRFLQTYDLTFDVSVFSFFFPLSIGACAYILPKQSIAYLEIASWLKKYKITVISMVPSVLNYLNPYFDELNFPFLRYSFFSGDSLYHKLATKWMKCIPNAQLINFYGPTETTIVCTYYIWNKIQSEIESENGIVPIGRCFPGMDYKLLDEHHNPVKEGEIGELCFSGYQVIDCYLNDHNHEKFIDIEIDEKFHRYYCTGDLARVNEKHHLLFHGRKDNQVKLNGYRVELSEVEFHINEFTDNKPNAIICKTNKDGHNLLYVFVENDVDITALDSFLGSKIPDYMLPHKIFCIPRIPYNSNGKIDRKELLLSIENL